MTREEAIENLKWLLECSYVDSFEDAENEALEMAIQALEQEPSKDAISRQAVIDILEKEGHKWGNDYRDWVDAVKDVETLPPVAPQPKMGHPQKSCDTCEHSDEMDGSNCYECIKGMRDRYDSQPICEEREKGECPYYAG